VILTGTTLAAIAENKTDKEGRPMSHILRALAERHQLPHLDPSSIDAFLAAGASPALLFFPGDPVMQAETNDVAIVFPQLLQSFRGRLRGGVIARPAVDRLKARFNVVVLPSLALVQGAALLGTIARIRDWAEYVAKLDGLLKGGGLMPAHETAETSDHGAEVPL
jgi:hydrogenase-1 operon protein HyaE